jgi:hypothetical protein
MKTPLTFYFYQVSLSKRLEGVISLSCSRVGLFLFTTSSRYFGCSMVIALLLFLTGTSGEPFDLNHPDLRVALLLVPRVLSIVLGLVWMSLAVYRLSMQLTRTDRWKQEMQRNEECLRHRVSVLEDWLVLPTYNPAPMEVRRNNLNFLKIKS